MVFEQFKNDFEFLKHFGGKIGEFGNLYYFISFNTTRLKSIKLNMFFLINNFALYLRSLKIGQLINLDIFLEDNIEQCKEIFYNIIGNIEVYKLTKGKSENETLTIFLSYDGSITSTVFNNQPCNYSFPAGGKTKFAYEWDPECYKKAHEKYINPIIPTIKYFFIKQMPLELRNNIFKSNQQLNTWFNQFNSSNLNNYLSSLVTNLKNDIDKLCQMIKTFYRYQIVINSFYYSLNQPDSNKKWNSTYWINNDGVPSNKTDILLANYKNLSGTENGVVFLLNKMIKSYNDLLSAIDISTDYTSLTINLIQNPPNINMNCVNKNLYLRPYYARKQVTTRMDGTGGWNPNWFEGYSLNEDYSIQPSYTFDKIDNLFYTIRWTENYFELAEREPGGSQPWIVEGGIVGGGMPVSGGIVGGGMPPPPPSDLDEIVYSVRK
jgi:hypothetical protein